MTESGFTETDFQYIASIYSPVSVLNSLLVPYCIIASNENNNAAMWEQASPSPAIHVQQELYHQAPQLSRSQVVFTHPLGMEHLQIQKKKKKHEGHVNKNRQVLLK